MLRERLLQRGAPDDDSSNLWTRRLGAGVDAVTMENNGCCEDATMDSAIIAVAEDDGQWDADNMVVATRCAWREHEYMQ